MESYILKVQCSDLFLCFTGNESRTQSIGPQGLWGGQVPGGNMLCHWSDFTFLYILWMTAYVILTCVLFPTVTYMFFTYRFSCVSWLFVCLNFASFGSSSLFVIIFWGWLRSLRVSSSSLGVTYLSLCRHSLRVSNLRRLATCSNCNIVFVADRLSWCRR